MLRLILLCQLANVLVAAPAHAAEHEKLLLRPPQGFQLVSESKTDNEKNTLLLPRGESVDHWTERLTAQIFYKMNDVAPSAFRNRQEKAAADTCPGARFKTIKTGTENLYPIAIWSQTCPHAKPSGRQETNWLKAVRGRDNFYLVQFAYGFEPNAKQIRTARKLLDATKVCDTRVPGQRCKLGR
ncbi:hypothetical protein OO17_25850 [Rhodopseudomonas palustris]|uniref:Uncharacterized protein n=2 Tax=Nitrobacteraceae TaxID=41294 RepID=A0A0D7E395_RHOPL|nr:hypothetical protein OO17_25850 [Rhodopseudomonas palustris]